MQNTTQHTPQAPAPFACTYSPSLPEFLMQLKSTILISTYQAGKVVFISPKNNEELIQLPRTFKKAMGIAVDGIERMAIATLNEVIYTTNSVELAKTYPSKPDVYDAFFMPRATYYTGYVDIHDLHFGEKGLYGINTSFSALCMIDEHYSFTPIWKPHFITELAAEDRCHLNGLAMQDGKPLYVSALGKGNTTKSWRENIVSGGIIMHVPSNSIIAEGLAMPHSPRIYDGKLYVLLSAASKLICIDPQNGHCEDVCHIPGFVRGMTKIGDYLFIATSKLRQNSSTFKHLAVAQKANEAGFVVVHLPTGSLTAKLTYLASVDEIYDIQILPGVIRPNIANTYQETHHQGLVTPESTYWAAPNEE